MTIRIRQSDNLRLFTISTSSLWFFFLVAIQFTVIYQSSGQRYIDAVVISIQTDSCHGLQGACMVKR